MHDNNHKLIENDGYYEGVAIILLAGLVYYVPN